MSMSREVGRKALATLLEAALVGDGLPVKVVTSAKPVKLAGQTPLVAITSDGSSRERMTLEGNRANFYLNVLVFVQQAEGDWTDAEAQDTLDTIERIIEETYVANTSTDNWEEIAYDDRTIVKEMSIEGNPYYVEWIPTVLMIC